jgi:hypothetical protein
MQLAIARLNVRKNDLRLQPFGIGIPRLEKGVTSTHSSRIDAIRHGDGRIALEISRRDASFRYMIKKNVSEEFRVGSNTVQ